MTNYQNYLHQQALKVAARYRLTESELLEIFQKIDKQRVYRQLGYGSLFVYATQALKLSEAVAYGFIQVARKSTQVPELKMAIAQGDITLSKAQRVAAVITPQNQTEILALAKSLPKRQLELEVAKLNPQALVPERARFVSDQRLGLKLGVSTGLMEQIKRVQDLLSTKLQRAASLEETIGYVTEEYLERHDPLKRAERAQESQGRQAKAVVPASAIETVSCPQVGNAKLCPGRAEPQAMPRHTIATKTKHDVMLRDEGRCTYVDPQGKRCSEQRWLDLHHQTPKCEGGSDSANNLALLCTGHHRVVHQA